MKMVSLCLRSWMLLHQFSAQQRREQLSWTDRFSLFMWKSRTQVCCECYNNRLCCFYNSLDPTEAPAFLPWIQGVFIQWWSLRRQTQDQDQTTNLWGYDPSADDQDIRSVQLPQLLHKLGDQRLVSSGQCADANTVDICIHGLLGHLQGRLLTRAEEKMITLPSDLNRLNDSGVF